jgi:flagellar biosynthesis/type III secretory pathway chaperone
VTTQHEALAQALNTFTSQLNEVVNRLESIAEAEQGVLSSDQWQTSLEDLIDMTRRIVDHLDASGTLIRFE